MERFTFKKSLVAVDEVTGCWLWQGALDESGYGIKYFEAAGKTIKQPAHRFYWEVFNNQKLPEEAICLHRCDVRNCVNPEHLEIGTVADNVRDMVRKGRMYRAGSTRKLNEELVAQIRADLAAGATKSALSRKHGVTRRTLREIELREIWKHVA